MNVLLFRASLLIVHFCKIKTPQSVDRCCK
nr:MAG TPA: hypothetical protein [Caudoviricetes sp.]